MKSDILIVGATGQQGRAVINALYKSAETEQQFRVVALTRSVSAAKSQSLQNAHPNLILTEGEARVPGPIFTAYPHISAIFLITVPPQDEEQALPLIDAATAPGSKVKHIVFSSVDRGGDVESWEQPTNVPHFAAKHRIELHLRRVCGEANIAWTILRPTAFMDTYKPAFFGKLMASLWAVGMPEDRRMQLVSTHDIGVFAAKALLDPQQWSGVAVALAGDDLSIRELRDVFKRATGGALPEAPHMVARLVLWWVEDARKSFEWFRSAGYRADIGRLRREEPALQDFETWLRQSSEWSANVSGQ